MRRSASWTSRERGAADRIHGDALFRAPPHHQIADYDLHGVVVCEERGSSDLLR
jgi:hypothetical protein